jgi:hypothetical protein
MKRLSGLVLLTLVVGVLSYLLTFNLKPALQVADFLPKETAILFESENLARSWERWQDTPLGKKINSSKFPDILDQLGVAPNRVAEFKAVRLFVDRLIGSSVLTTFFTKKSVIALLPDFQTQPFNTPALLKHLVLIVPAQEKFSSSGQIAQFPPTVLQSAITSIYQGVPLLTLTLQSGQRLCLSRYRGQLICAFDPKPVQRCIDQALNRMVRASTGLQSNQEYRELKRRAGHSEFFMYANSAMLAKQWPVVAGREDEKQPLLLPHHIAMFHLEEPDHERLALIARMPPGQLAIFTAKYRLAKPVNDPVGSRLSTNTQFYLWTNWFNPKILWHWGLQLPHPQTGTLMSRLSQLIQQSTGKSLDEFFNVFGSGFGVFIKEQRVPALFSEPMACLYVQVHDQQEIGALLKQLFNDLPVKTQLSGGTEIVSLVMAGGLLQPAYALFDDHLVLADSAELIVQLQRQGGLLPSMKNKVPAPSEGKAGNFFLYFKTKSVAERLIAVLSLFSGNVAEKEKFLPQTNRLFIEHVVIPVLMDLESSETSGIRGYAATDEIILEIDFSSGVDGFHRF